MLVKSFCDDAEPNESRTIKILIFSISPAARSVTDLNLEHKESYKTSTVVLILNRICKVPRSVKHNFRKIFLIWISFDVVANNQSADPSRGEKRFSACFGSWKILQTSRQVHQISSARMHEQVMENMLKVNVYAFIMPSSVFQAILSNSRHDREFLTLVNALAMLTFSFPLAPAQPAPTSD